MCMYTISKYTFICYTFQNISSSFHLHFIPSFIFYFYFFKHRYKVSWIKQPKTCTIWVSKGGFYFAPSGTNMFYGWVVVLAAAIIRILVYGISYTSGVVYVVILENFKTGAAETSWISSLITAMTFLVSKYNCRSVMHMFIKGAKQTTTRLPISRRLLVWDALVCSIEKGKWSTQYTCHKI